MRLVAIQQQDDAPPGHLAGWARDRGHSLVVVRADREEKLPPHDEVDAAIVLGSDHSVTDLPGWMAGERAWIETALARDVPVLGICFGAQLLAAVAGGAVRRAAQPEIDWITARGAGSLPAGPWLAWHEDEIVRLPHGARELARSDSGLQAYALGPHLGVQFHPEVTPGVTEAWAIAATRDLRVGRERAEAIVRQARETEACATVRAGVLFDAFVEQRAAVR